MGGKIYLKVLAIITLLLLSTYIMIGCKGSAGIRNGAIRGKVQVVGGGTLPAVTVRAEAVDRAVTDKEPISEYVVVTNVDGTFEIPSVPVGIYKMYFQVEGYEVLGGTTTAPYAGGTAGGSTTTGGGTTGEGSTGGTTTGGSTTGTGEMSLITDSGVKAYVQSGRTYELPTIWLRKLADIKPGKITGHVYDQQSGIIAGALVYLENTFFSTVSDSNGKYTLSNVPLGTYTLKASKEGYKDSPGITINMVSGNEAAYIVRDIRLEPEDATITGVIQPKNYPGLFDEIYDKIQVVVEGTDAHTTASGGRYTLTVPIGPSSYKVRFIHPFVEDTYVLVQGPLTAGQTVSAPTAELTYKTRQVTVQAFVAYAQNNKMVGIYTDVGNSTTVYWPDTGVGGAGNTLSNASTLSGVPFGKRVFHASGVERLDPSGATYVDPQMEVQVDETLGTLIIPIGENAVASSGSP